MRIGIAVFVGIQVSRLAWAQEPKPPADSARTDTTLSDSISVYPNHGGMFAALAAAAVVLAVAPSASTRFTTPDTTMVASPARDHLSVYVTGGGSWIEGQKWAYSASAELLENGWYAEMRVETFHLPEHFQYQSIIGGYLFRPKRGVAGGATLGYRRAPRDRTQRGVMIGFPLWVDGGDGTLRVESTYVFSPSGVNWNYRFLGEFPIGDGPFSLGLSMEAKSLPLESRSKLFASSIAALIGVRL